VSFRGGGGGGRGKAPAAGAARAQRGAAGAGRRGQGRRRAAVDRARARLGHEVDQRRALRLSEEIVEHHQMRTIQPRAARGGRHDGGVQREI